MVTHYGRSWDEVIDLALMSIRTTVNDSTKVSPYLLVYGKAPITVHGVDISRRTKENNYHSSVDDLIKKIQENEELVKSNVNDSQNRNIWYINLNENHVKFEPGSWIRIRKQNPSAFEPRYSQPMKVIHEQIPGTYLVEDNKGKRFPVHHDRLKAHVIDEKYHKPPTEKRPLALNRENMNSIMTYMPSFSGGRNVTCVD
ncbi:hypothetical protein RF11_15903 [Thelohanellus kitauei]|uniref:Retrovirus-related Pol polyprotein n=1 Tax=Thelohanellus kitauei TaxID=669202 RepID=A0A0C2J7J0_THEKT|nr:hypothetical protein RF11_15903 [Thelohanellus kitauei]